MQKTIFSFAFVLAALVAVGCDKKDGGSALTCEQVVPHMNSLMAAEAPEADRAKATADLATGLQKTIAECKTKNMTPEAMKCLMDAKTTAEFGKCK